MVRGACAGLGRPLDVVAEVAGVADTVDHRLVHRLRLHLELELNVQRAGGDEGVVARGRGALQGLGGAVDVAAGGAGEARNAGRLDSEEERRVGKAWVSAGRSRASRLNSK